METKPHKYKVLQDWDRGEVVGGDIVYSLLACEYALARADTRETGKEHISVTKREDGGCEGFTIPLDFLEDLEPTPKISLSDKCKAIPRGIFQNLVYFFEDFTSSDPCGKYLRMDALVWVSVVLLAYISVTYSEYRMEQNLAKSVKIIYPPIG